MADRLQRMLSTREVLEPPNCSKTTLYNDTAARRFPRPVKLNPMRNDWPEPDLVAEQEALIADRNARAAEFREGA
jgi:predicted DNA-binding transcriptional regulator AlpA